MSVDPRKWLADRQTLIDAGAYDPDSERDACGVGLVAAMDGQPRRDVVDLAIAALKAVWHRGAVDADGRSGDGAGLLIGLPRDFFLRQVREQGREPERVVARFRPHARVLVLPSIVLIGAVGAATYGALVLEELWQRLAVAGAGLLEQGLEGHVLQLRLLQLRARGVEALAVDDAGVLVATGRDVELALLVHAVQPVEAGLVQVDEHRRALRAVCAVPRLVVAGAHAVVGLLAVVFGQGLERVDHRVDLVAHHAIGLHQRRVHVTEERALRTPGEEHRRPPGEGLDVAHPLDPAGEQRQLAPRSVRDH